MPRGRKQLTDKQERILVQCQLMGLTTADLVTISNRLKALDREREFKELVADHIDGFSWTVKDHRNFTITDRDGKVYDVKVVSEYGRDFHSHRQDYAKITVSKPGTRFKVRSIKPHRLVDLFNGEPSHLCPEGNKFLYRTMREIKRGRIA